MFTTLARAPKALNDYASVSSRDAIDEVREVARGLRGLRVLQLSATAFGTGVADLLQAAVPLLGDLGLECEWRVVRPTEESASANKALYRALAGLSVEWSPEMGDTWLRYSAMSAELLADPFDVVVVHDPQPAALRSFASDAARGATRWAFHSHLDLSSATAQAWALVQSHVESYDAIIFDDDSFVHPALRSVPITIIRPAIDPLGPRNMELSDETMAAILERYGIDPRRPLICQQSPCDPECDLLGAMDVHRLVAEDVAELQLALIASNPPEDEASCAHLDEAVRRSKEEPSVRILRGVNEVGNVEVNAFQRASDVVLQRGLRRGFGIWIADALWKERPVVAAPKGSLPRLVLDGETGFLARSTDEFAERVTRVLHDRELASRLGSAGRRHVTENFSIVRFLKDELRLLTDLVRRA